MLYGVTWFLSQQSFRVVLLSRARTGLGVQPPPPAIYLETRIPWPIVSSYQQNLSFTSWTTPREDAPYQIAQSLFWRKRSFSPLGTISEWSESASEGSRGTARHSLNPTGPTSWAPSFCPQPSTRQHLDLVFFSINSFRHARPLASICHFLPSLHCLLFPIARFSAVVCTQLPASREFTQTI
jgi:hypothetical protein